jgi:hypothetical protein
MPALTGSVQSVPLGEGYAIRAPGILGAADLQRPRDAAARARSRSAEDGTPALEAALAATNVTEVRQVDLRLQPSPPAGPASALRSGDGQEMVELQVPDLGADTGQLVLACDEAGVLTWHLPVDDQLAVQPPATRGSGGVKKFRIPATRPAPPPPDVAASRSLLGLVGRKLLKVLVYPVLDPVVGAISEAFAERWEAANRPYGVRLFTPTDFRAPVSGTMSAADWSRLGAGRALLFIHGTFSTAHGAFGQIPDAAFQALFQRYGERVLAFDHFTLSHDPRRNVEWLLEHIPPGLALDLDVVCHSRGGLVARTLAERPSAFGLDSSRVNVQRVVFVCTPNQGTLLAHPDHMVRMIDRLTTALNLFPTGPVTETLEALITAVKVIGHGALKGLEGLASMRPGGPFLKELNGGSAPSNPGYCAIAADFEPVDQGLRALVTGSLADAVLDRVFQDVANDLVVPEPGVYGANGTASFPIPDARLLKAPPADGIIHTTIFGYPPATAKLLEWLVC